MVGGGEGKETSVGDRRTTDRRRSLSRWATARRIAMVRAVHCFCFPTSWMIRFAVLGFAAVLFAGSLSCQAEPAADGGAFFRADDVVALVGGEDVVVMGDQPHLELLVLRQPGLSGVKFRNLAFEGDTVFEQFRQLNFPSWEDQMKAVGATVVVAQFGKMESLAGPEGAAAFAESYERLIDRLAGSTRRVLLLAARSPKGSRPESIAPYNDAARALAVRRGWMFLETPRPPWVESDISRLGLAVRSAAAPALADSVRRKNRLWFHYWRPQNWAFLHGDRTGQASSRDHRDPSRRWFPEEMREWLPLIATKESEIKDMIDADRQP